MAEVHDLVYAAALNDFHEARRQAALQDLKARLTGKSDDLLSYEAIREMLRAEDTSHRQLQEIPLDAIVGSVGRYARLHARVSASTRGRHASLGRRQSQGALPGRLRTHRRLPGRRGLFRSGWQPSSVGGAAVGRDHDPGLCHRGANSRAVDGRTSSRTKSSSRRAMPNSWTAGAWIGCGLGRI